MSVARTCPECGTRVGAFAAGCAVCGADLEAHARRARLAAQAAAADEPVRRGRLPRLSFPRPGVSVLELVYLAITLFAVAFLAPLAILLAVLGAMHGRFEGRRGLLVLYAGLAVIAAALELSRL